MLLNQAALWNIRCIKFVLLQFSYAPVWTESFCANLPQTQLLKISNSDDKQFWLILLNNVKDTLQAWQ